MVHLNVVGGIKVNDPACDLSVALAVVSAYKNIPVDPELIAIGELGLQGEVRGTADLPRRLEEAARLGFKRALIPKRDLTGLPQGIEIIPANSLQEAITIGLSR